MPTLNIGALIDPSAAVVRVHRDASGRIAEASFDLNGVPRVDELLKGRPVAEVVELVTHLCGICPITHHLAGMAALDQLGGVEALPPAARAIRLLLHHASVVEALAPRFLYDDREAAGTLIRFAADALRAAGCEGHFPRVAVPGGVSRRGEAPTGGDDAMLAADRLVDLHRGDDACEGDPFDGINLVLRDDEARPDPLGSRVLLRGRLEDAREVAGAICERRLGEACPRPVLRWHGRDLEYRTGPCAHFPGMPARLAQARVLERSVRALTKIAVPAGALSTPCRPDRRGDRGVGMVDGPRGLLIHDYRVDAEGIVTAARILSPTAQNETWLSSMLTTALREGAGRSRLEEIIRAADPCLPCTMAPPGQMPIDIREGSERHDDDQKGSG